MKFTENSVLLVDDEKQVLYALNRVIRPLQCKVFMADSAAVALDILKTHHIDIVISDMRMPEIAGEQFLQQVAEQWPDVERVALTGFADSSAIMAAINQGKVSRFMLKPWNDDELLKTIENSFLLSAGKRKASILQRMTREKNTQLQQLNRTLEQRVQQRTEQLRQMNTSLQASYRAVVNMLSNLSMRRMGVKTSRENQQFTPLMRETAVACGIEGEALKDLMTAWQFRHLGKLSFSDSLLQVPYLSMTAEQQKQFHTHPLLAQASCLPVKPLHAAGQILRQHREYLDGTGYPGRLKADQISLSAQILCAVNDYVELISGHYAVKPQGHIEALRYLRDRAASRYSQNVVAQMKEVLEALSSLGEALNDAELTSNDLIPGMTLSRDLFSPSGILLLGAGQVLNETLIERIREMEYNLEEVFQFFIQR